MLVLTRKVNESVAISGGIVIKVTKIQGNSVRLGIVAPMETKILRVELDPYEEKASEELYICAVCRNEKWAEKTPRIEANHPRGHMCYWTLKKEMKS